MGPARDRPVADMTNRMLPLHDARRIAVEAAPVAPPLVEVDAQRLADVARHGAIGSEVLHREDCLYMAFAGGAIACFDCRNLTEKWRFAVPAFDLLSRFDGTVVLEDDAAIVRVADHWMVLDAASGALRKEFTGPAMNLRRGAVVDGRVLAPFRAGTESAFGSLDPATGELRWSRALARRGRGVAVLTAARGIVGFAVTPSTYSAFDLDSGAPRWSLDVSDIGRSETVFGREDGVVSGWAIAVGELFVLPVRSGHWLGVSIDDGSIAWKLEVPCRNPGNAAYPGQGKLYSFADGHYLVIDPSDGTLLVDEPIDEPELAMGGIGSPLLTPSHLWGVHIDSGRVFALERDSGRPAWVSPPNGATPVDRPPTIACGLLHTVDLSGRLRTFEPAPGG